MLRYKTSKSQIYIRTLQQYIQVSYSIGVCHLIKSQSAKKQLMTSSTTMTIKIFKCAILVNIRLLRPKAPLPQQLWKTFLIVLDWIFHHMRPRKTSVQHRTMLLDIPQILSVPHTDRLGIFFIQHKARDVIISLQFVPKTVIIVIDVFFHFCVLQSCIWVWGDSNTTSWFLVAVDSPGMLSTRNK